MMGFGIMGFGWFIGILLIAAIVWLIIYAAKSRPSERSDHKSKAMEILNERFARGEIGQDEYRRKAEILSH